MRVTLIAEIRHLCPFVDEVDDGEVEIVYDQAPDAPSRTCSRECFRERMRRVQSASRNNAKLSLEQTAEIARRVLAGERGKDLASEFGVSAPTVTRIKQEALARG